MTESWAWLNQISGGFSSTEILLMTCKVLEYIHMKTQSQFYLNYKTLRYNQEPDPQMKANSKTDKDYQCLSLFPVAALSVGVVGVEDQ